MVPEAELLRADHLLHHGSVRDLDLVAGRLSHLLPSVRAVHVRWDEPAALGARAAEFDRVGVVRDMVNSHLLQLAATVLAAVPATATDEEARAARDAVLADLDLPREETPGAAWLRARYGAGTVDGRPVAAYAEEPGVRAERGTETFASVVLRLRRADGDLDVRLTTGKALSPVRREVVLHLDDPELPRTVRLDLSGARLQMTEDDEEDVLNAPPLHAPASAHMLSDARAGVLRRFVSAAACARQWTLTEAVAEVLAALPMTEYAAGSPGPEVPCPDSGHEHDALDTASRLHPSADVGECVASAEPVDRRRSCRRRRGLPRRPDPSRSAARSLPGSRRPAPPRASCRTAAP